MPRILVFSVLLSLVALVSAAEVRLPHANLTLTGNLEKVDGNWPRGPVVLMTHGTLAHGGMEIMRGLQTLLQDRGISSLAINLSLGLDDRHGMYDCSTPHHHKHSDAVDEIGVWLDWLKTQGAEKVALLGHSRGGNQTARFAAAHGDPAIVAVILIAPQTWSPEQEAQGYRNRYGKDLSTVLGQARALVADGKGDTLMDPVDFIYCEKTRATADAFVAYYGPDEDMDTPRLIPRIQAPVVVFAGSEDRVVAGLVEKTEPLADGQKVRLVVIDGADHFFRDLYSEDIADAVAAMIEVE